MKGNITHPIGEAVRWDYDETDDLVDRSDNAGREKRYEYDRIGRRQKSLMFRKCINHPGGSDLIYYPENVGLPKNPKTYSTLYGVD